jgi:hypothetical protein
MSNDILTLQSETAKRHIELFATVFKNCFIHGVGEGVLKAELDFYWDAMTICFSGR